MTATAITAAKAITALERVRSVVEEHGSEEQRARLHGITGHTIPSPNRSPIEHAAYQDEALAILAEMVGDLVEANKPRPRGRPRKSSLS
jgi:hypothetical protein